MGGSDLHHYSVNCAIHISSRSAARLFSATIDYNRCTTHQRRKIHSSSLSKLKTYSWSRLDATASSPSSGKVESWAPVLDPKR